MTIPGTKIDIDDKDLAMIVILILCGMSLVITHDITLTREGLIAVAAFVTGRKSSN